MLPFSHDPITPTITEPTPNTTSRRVAISLSYASSVAPHGLPEELPGRDRDGAADEQRGRHRVEQLERPGVDAEGLLPLDPGGVLEDVK